VFGQESTQDRRTKWPAQAASHLGNVGFLLGFLLTLGLLFEPGNRTPAQTDSEPIVLSLANWEARINPESLTIVGKMKSQSSETGGKSVVLAERTGRTFGVEGLETAPDHAHWRIPELGLDVELTRQEHRLRVRFQAERELAFEWPATGRDPALSALIYPDGEGLYIPLDDSFWRRVAKRDPCRDTHGGLSMPFWSYRGAGGTWTYLAVSDLQTTVCLEDSGGRLTARASHDFRARDGFRPYEIEIWPGGDSPISPAREYRQWLIEQSRYVTLDQKARANPQVTKLVGAVHAYVFGDGRSLDFLNELARLGVDRMWLGYDQDTRQRGTLVSTDYIREAKRLGFLVAPYDTFDNAQDPTSADASDSIWGSDLFPAGCIVNEKGGIQKGFAGRGCELSSEALALREPKEHNLENRIASRAQTGVNSYFLDSDAYGELYDDYSKAHPMTPELDRRNRLARMRMIAENHGLVLGSEAGAAWSAPVIAFAHGTEAVSNEFLWPLERDRKRFGGWWPPARPGIFFKSVEPDEDFRRARYDPSYRLPLYQSVFHGSVVSVERWETPLTKFPGLYQVRALLELLYNVPSMWSLDLNELRQDEPLFLTLYYFYSPIHRAVGGQPLEEFDWLTPDRLVQRTRFGDEIELTANFSSGAFETLPPMCIEARWLRSGRRQRFCPGPLPTSSRARKARPAQPVFSLNSPRDRRPGHGAKFRKFMQ
jgi:glycosyl hydrolase family 129